MSKIILLPHGTAGDVLPYIWLGRQLMQRGHQVTMIWVDAFQLLAEKAGLEYVPMVNAKYEEFLSNSMLWDAHKGFQAGFAYAGDCIGSYTDAFATYVEREGLPDLLISPQNNFVAPLLREKHGLPLVSVVLHPLAFISAHEISCCIPCWRLLRMLPVFARSFFLSAIRPYDRFAMPQIRKQCALHKVKPPKNLRRDWWSSPDGTLALFPEWYGKPQPDWPVNYFQWDFPLEDLRTETALSPEFEAFLEAGSKPVVFTLGTGHVHARPFFETAVELCSQLGCRGVFVSRDPAQIPDNLPASIMAVQYAPFSVLLPRASACVHHGGIGTLSQCFRAGLPQFIVSMAFDQPDNAERVKRFGAGVSIDIRQFNVKRALPLLRRCLEDVAIHQKAAACTELLVGGRPSVDALMEWLEHRMKPMLKP
ncbi:MAG: glycosyltransferase [Prosthecobacter sp.]|uniref:glycosyltransferase n=1 Tax=Prosthecobacter sp. TaxID=1965333 RepID=UPI0025F00246|nr:nucleotide disphospho-sugar-binding domain-containing protein [Prosthecobacter sp.]MCF7786124.1 glycosyltransferase [Prosthecobacter sp.]